ncbi:right-handed parallel beta-helix repeat-containing protein [Streptomyces sp. NBC_00091]|uniref:right-handed parallel beta-helix repeat-containing protein n=1 Tax=Streptomyces sp. NBC_00091 TaxID=2975648 RepID=UPI002259F157|nr:right-handed parallel beta-helix repeat-containing protein [Streptomyces sp. NBC_00091]MCX5381418.1 right-handed parallel beta-helix repeat-containing protein [Streptomyces sp. NBC_00091]
MFWQRFRLSLVAPGTAVRGRVTWLTVLCVSSALSLALTPGAQAAKPKPVHVSCGETITTDTKLTNDLTNCPHSGIIIGADDITLDLNGHTIDGAGDGAGVENLGHDRISIKGGSVREFADGILIAEATDNRLRDLRVSDSGHVGINVLDSVDVRIETSSVVASRAAGISFERGSRAQVTKTKSSANGQSGIALVDSSRVRIAQSELFGNAAGAGVERSPHTRIERSSVFDNREDGVLLREGSDHSVVSQNSVTGNAFGIGLDIGTAHIRVTKNTLRNNTVVGVYLAASDDNVITQNSVIGNGDGAEGGIHLLAQPDDPTNTSDRNLISQNTLTGNDPDGILVEAGQRENVVERNRSSGNADDGIDVDSSATTITKNTANRNGDLGIEAVPGVTDGGGNKASGNGNLLQCTNVLCNER